MNSDVLISFVVPVYNVENTLAKCLDSILNQGIQDFEIIIVNDGTKDNSQKIIDDYVAKYPEFIKTFIKVNGGLGDARNYGIKRANGEYVAFVDSDDFIEPNYLDVVKSIIDTHHPDLVIISYNRVYNKKQNIFEKYYRFNRGRIFNKAIDIKTTPEVICRTEVATWLRIIKREVLAKDDLLLFTYGRIYEDLEASLKWYLNVDKIVVSKEKLYNYVITSNTLNFNGNSIEHFIGIMDSVILYYKNVGKFQEYYSELEFLFAKHTLISNMLRLKVANHENKYQVFLSLRKAMKDHFPRYTKNKYFKNEPLYLRAAIIISNYTPKIFYVFLIFQKWTFGKKK